MTDLHFEASVAPPACIQSRDDLSAPRSGCRCLS
jgi:hypothetical protein